MSLFISPLIYCLLIVCPGEYQKSFCDGMPAKTLNRLKDITCDVEVFQPVRGKSSKNDKHNVITSDRIPLYLAVLPLGRWFAGFQEPSSKP
jgi:hypothetical protein